ncbi:MAG: hypothetical protein M1825_003262 [Sarcosagium campestre]|nr:MAG: hypothetical protein M1825_003262 [Sarcosagium campestre]
MATNISLTPHRIERSSKQVKVVFDGVYIASTKSPLLVWEQPNRPPQYYLPEEDLLYDNVKIEPASPATVTGPTQTSAAAGGGSGTGQGGSDDSGLIEKFWLETRESSGRRTAIYTFRRSGPLQGFIRLEFADFDAWFENGALTRLPPKNPFRRIDTALTSAHVVVKIGSVAIADARDAVVLFETGLPPRYYLPATSVRDWKKLEKSDKVTACPYKGEARYFTVKVDGKTWEDLVWYYLYPVAESAAIAGRLAFTAGKEGVSITVDGDELTS